MINQYISNSYATKNNYFSHESLKPHSLTFTFKYLDIDDKRYIHGKESFDALQKEREKSVILKPDKGQCIVLVIHNDYISFSAQKIKFSMKVFFSKFDQIRSSWKTPFSMQCLL